VSLDIVVASEGVSGPLQAEPLNLRSSPSERPALTARQRRLGNLVLGLTGASILLSFCFWWPTFSDLSRFAYLCLFPVGVFFLLDLRFSRNLRDQKFFPWFALLHCAFLSIAIYLWQLSPARLSVRNPDFIFGFQVVEFALFLLLIRVLRLGRVS
jgi:hypothetical protein